MAENDEEEKVSRRRFIKNSGMVAGGVVGGSLLGGFFTNQFGAQNKEETKSNEETSQLQQARTFFSRDDDFETLAAATERIFPENDQGPGAIELGVPFFIDKQLSGWWGSNTKAYMRDPFTRTKADEDYQFKDTKQDKSGPNTTTQGVTSTPRYQTRLNRGELFLAGLRRMQEVSQEEYDDDFVDLDEEKQDEILKMFESAEVEMVTVMSNTFFNLLLQTTLEGAYADPVYGGNKEMMGWKMKEYPGPRMSWTDKIDAEDFISLDPKSLRAYQGGGV